MKLLVGADGDVGGGVRGWGEDGGDIGGGGEGEVEGEDEDGGGAGTVSVVLAEGEGLIEASGSGFFIGDDRILLGELKGLWVTGDEEDLVDEGDGG